MHKNFGDTYLAAKKAGYLYTLTTTEGDLIYLSYSGRQQLGLANNHMPPPWQAQTHYYRRRIIRHLAIQGYSGTSWYAKNLLSFSNYGLVAAKHNGYTARSVRRILKQLRVTPYHLHIYTPYPNRLKVLEQKHEQLTVHTFL